MYRTINNEKDSCLIRGGNVITNDRILRETDILSKGNQIHFIGKNIDTDAHRVIEAYDKYVMPGIIDLHSDALEKYIEPRPGAVFPHNIAIVEFDKIVAASGITTIFHCMAFMEMVRKGVVRSVKNASNTVVEIKKLLPGLNVNTRIHARFDVLTPAAIPFLEKHIADRDIQLLSFMDHTPGQGQYRDINKFQEQVKDMMSEEEAERVFKLYAQKGNQDSTENIKKVAEFCRKHDIPMASHDDDSPEKVAAMKDIGITISEFPVTWEALEAAHTRGLHTCVGSPNALRGASHSNNISARIAIEKGQADILCSDYSPMSMLHSVFKLYEMEAAPLHELVKLVSLNPAKAARINAFTGSLEQGKDADIIIVDTNSKVPRLCHTLVRGREVISTSGI